MLKLQRCNSHGDFISDSDCDELPCEIDMDEIGIVRHKCLIQKGVFYFKTIEESIAWGVVTDQYDITRCVHCGGMWPIYVSNENLK